MQKPGPASLERGHRPGRPNPVMTENSNPKNGSGEPEHGNSLRAWMIDALAMAMGALAVLHYKPEDFLAGLIVFVGAYTLTHSLRGLNWKLLTGICEFLLIVLAAVIHLGTLATAPASFTGLVFTFLLPGIAQAYWLWELWPATGALAHPLTLMCAAWLALLGIRILAQAMRVNRRVPQSN